MSAPTGPLFAALRSTLTGGTALTSLLAGGTASIYALQAADNAALPYVVYSLQSGIQEEQPRTPHNQVVYIRAYAASLTTANSIDAAIDALIDGKKLSVTGWGNFYTARVQDLANIETTPAGTNVYMAGGFYRIRLSK